jgi:hypothetical protein
LALWVASWKVWGLRERASLLVRLCCGPRAGGFAAPALSVGCARNQEGALLPNQEELALALLVHLPGAKTLLGTFSSLQALKLCLARFLPFAKYRILKLTRFIDCLHVSVFEKPDISPQTKYSADFAFFCDTLFCDSINDGLVLPYFGFDFLKLLSRWEASLCLVQPQNSFIYLT